MLFVNKTYRSFASLRMTGFRCLVILSEAKDLYALFSRDIESDALSSETVLSCPVILSEAQPKARAAKDLYILQTNYIPMISHVSVNALHSFDSIIPELM